VEELQGPWEEDALHKGLPGRQLAAGMREFATTITTGNGLFGKDPEYWQTVHLCGDGLEAEMAAARQKVPPRCYLLPPPSIAFYAPDMLVPCW
jgi:hypothetical protein